jgi:hypothetical protein
LSYTAEVGRCRYCDDICVGSRGMEMRKPRSNGHLGKACLTHRSRFKTPGWSTEVKGYTAKCSFRQRSQTHRQQPAARYCKRTSRGSALRRFVDPRRITDVFMPPLEEKRTVINIQVKHAAGVWDEAADAWLMSAELYGISTDNSSASISQRLQFSIATPVHWTGL